MKSICDIFTIKVALLLMKRLNEMELEVTTKDTVMCGWDETSHTHEQLRERRLTGIVTLTEYI